MTIEDCKDELTIAAKLIDDADGLIIAAGAGMGVDSGLPDFRGKAGFWQVYPALSKMNLDLQTIGSPASFQTMPSRAWGFYGHRLDLYRRTDPHLGFHLLKKWGDRMVRGYSVFTSNVDGQFQRAGFSSSRIHECHGSIHHMQCCTPCTDDIWDADTFAPDIDETNCLLINSTPKCIHCGGLARPNILMFNDTRWIDARQEMQAQRQRGWLSSLKKPVVIELGAGTAIATVRNFSERTVRQYNGILIRINPVKPSVSRQQDISLALGAAEALNAIEEIMNVPKS